MSEECAHVPHFAKWDIWQASCLRGNSAWLLDLGTKWRQNSRSDHVWRMSLCTSFREMRHLTSVIFERKLCTASRKIKLLSGEIMQISLKVHASKCIHPSIWNASNHPSIDPSIHLLKFIISSKIAIWQPKIRFFSDFNHYRPNIWDSA